MARWFTADLHLGHANIIGYCRRPFTDVDDMDLALIESWNSCIGTDDEVWVLGDFALGRIADTLALAGLLNGNKLLVPGNHDRCWPHAKKGSGEWARRYREAGFEIAAAGATVTVAGHRVLVSHFPYEGDSRDEDRFVKCRLVDRGGWLLHGHVHDKWRQRGRMINVGVDAWAGRPVGEEILAQMIDAGPARRDRLQWPPYRS